MGSLQEGKREYITLFMLGSKDRSQFTSQYCYNSQINHLKLVSEKPLHNNCRDLAILKEGFEKYACINKSYVCRCYSPPHTCQHRAVQASISMNTNFGKIWQKIKTDTSVESWTF